MTFDATFATELLLKIIEKLIPDHRNTQQEVDELRRKHPYASREELAKIFAARARLRYTTAGAVSALPGLVPGLGTAAQVVAESAAVLGDVPYMVRQFADVMQGVCMIYGFDNGAFDKKLFMRVLGYWCKALKFAREAAVAEAAKQAGKFVSKYFSRDVTKRISQHVGRRIVTKYGTKRGFVSVGRMIPLGVGIGVGAAFNFATMHCYNKACIAYFEYRTKHPDEDVYEIAA